MLLHYIPMIFLGFLILIDFTILAMDLLQSIDSDV